MIYLTLTDYPELDAEVSAEMSRDSTQRQSPGGAKLLLLLLLLDLLVRRDAVHRCDVISKRQGHRFCFSGSHDAAASFSLHLF